MTKLAPGPYRSSFQARRSRSRDARRIAAAAGGSAALCARIKTANTAAEAFALAQSQDIALGDTVARAAQATAARVIAGRDIAVEIVLFDREQNLVGRAPFRLGFG